VKVNLVKLTTSSHLETFSAAKLSPIQRVAEQSESEREKDKGQGKAKNPPIATNSSFARNGTPYAPISYGTFRDEDLQMTMQTQAPHAIEGYVPVIPTVGPLSRVNKYGGYSTPRSRLSLWAGMPLLLLPPQLQLQPVNRNDQKQHKLDEKITEEELRRRSLEQQRVEDEDEASSFEEVKAQKKLVKESGDWRNAEQGSPAKLGQAEAQPWFYAFQPPPVKKRSLSIQNNSLGSSSLRALPPYPWVPSGPMLSCR